MVGNARPERVVNGICHAGLDRQFVTLGQPFETRDAGATVPGSQAKGITSSGQTAPSTSVKRKTHPWASIRRPSSRAMLVFPIRRCPVSRMWLPARTRASRIRNSDSRSMKSVPLTQRPVASLMTPPVVDNATVITVFDINFVVNGSDAHGDSVGRADRLHRQVGRFREVAGRTNGGRSRPAAPSARRRSPRCGHGVAAPPGPVREPVAGMDGTTTWKESSARPPWATGSVRAR